MTTAGVTAGAGVVAQPEPPINVTFDGSSVPLLVVAAAFVLGLVIGVLYLFAWAILRASNRPAPIALTVALSMLTFLALVLSFVHESPSIETIAAAGLGALASAVSQQFARHDVDDER